MDTLVNYTAPKIIYAEEKKISTTHSKIETKCDLFEAKCKTISQMIQKANLYLDRVN